MHNARGGEHSNCGWYFYHEAKEVKELVLLDKGKLHATQLIRLKFETPSFLGFGRCFE